MTHVSGACDSNIDADEHLKAVRFLSWLHLSWRVFSNMIQPLEKRGKVEPQIAVRGYCNVRGVKATLFD